MPRLRRKLKTRTAWTDEQRHALWHHDWFQVFTDDEHEQAAWEHFRAELLADWIRERPGTRPRPWWKFDAPAEREYFGTEVKWTFGNGTPKEKRLPLTGAPQGWYGILVPAIEAEARFLERHDLLTAEERQALERNDEHDDHNT